MTQTTQEIRFGDMHRLFGDVADNSVDMVFADVPYGEDDKAAFEKKFDSPYKMISKEWDKNDEGQIDAINWRVVNDGWRVLKPGGWLILTCSPTNKLKLYSLLGDNMKAKGKERRETIREQGLEPYEIVVPDFRFINEVTWHKPNAVPFLHAQKLRRQAPSCEFVLFYGKGVPTTFNYEWLKNDRTIYEQNLVDMKRVAKTGKFPQLKDYWEVAEDMADREGQLWDINDNEPWKIGTDTRSYTPYEKDEDGKTIRHPAQKPYRLMRRIVLGFSAPGQTILDPCCGSGTLGRLCREYDRNFIGMDNDEQMVRLARMQLDDPSPVYFQNAA